ncbi:MAG: HlyD family efflux transporter periplasmic adaptor subunit [Rhodanobacteraceae bacterium]
MKKLLVVLVVVVVVAALAWWLIPRSTNDGSDLTLQGNVDIRQVSLAFDGNGRVAELRAEEGDAVKADQIVAVLDTRIISLQAEQAKAQIKVQQQNLARLHNGSRPEEIAQARSQLAAATADARRAEQDSRRLEEISKTTQGRGVSPQELDRARSALDVARAKSESQRQALRLTEVGPRAEDIAAAQAQLESSQAQLALLEFQISQGELKSPTDAVVRSRLVEPGDMVTAQRAIYTLALTHPKWIRVYVDESDLGRVKPGMAARIVTDTDPKKPVQGSVGYISSVAEFTPKFVQTEELRTSLVYEVRVVADDKDDRLRLGQPVTVHLAAGAKP